MWPRPRPPAPAAAPLETLARSQTMRQSRRRETFWTIISAPLETDRQLIVRNKVKCDTCLPSSAVPALQSYNNTLETITPQTSNSYFLVIVKLHFDVLNQSISCQYKQK